MAGKQRPSWPLRSEEVPSDRVVIALAGLLVAFIVGMLAVPYLFQLRFSQLRHQREQVIEPALDHLDEIQLALARELAAYRGYLLSGDPRFLSRLRQAVADRQTATTRLDSLAPRIGPEVGEAMAVLRQAVAGWSASEASLLGIPQGGLSQELHLSQDEYESALQASAGVRDAVSARTAVLVAGLRSTERWWGWAQMALLTLALAGVAVVLWGAHLVRYHRRSRRAPGAD